MSAAPPKTLPRNRLWLETESVSPGGRGCWYAKIPEGHTIKDVLGPAYFAPHAAKEAHHTRSLMVGDLIDCEPDGAEFRIQVRVMAYKEEYDHLLVREQQRWDFAVKLPAGFRCEWHGGTGKWRLFKGEFQCDQDRPGFDTQDEAAARARDLTREKAA